MNILIQKSSIDYDEINAEALENAVEILEKLLPDGEGELRGEEYVALNPTRSDGAIGSFSINTETGVWNDFALTGVGGGDLISLVAYLKDTTQPLAAQHLQSLVGEMQIPAKTTTTTKKSPKVREGWTPIIPVPLNAPPLILDWMKPEGRWEYRTADGGLALVLYRFGDKSGKRFTPYTYCRNAAGQESWKTQTLPAPRPLYNLDKIAAESDKPVMVCEGEKSADAAARLFPGYITTTSLNGAQSPKKTDWSPLTGRQVVIWRDHDEAGVAYQNTVVELLQNLDAAPSISILKPFQHTPTNGEHGVIGLSEGFTPSKGWDAADAIVAGWTPEHIALLGDDIYEPVVEKIKAVKAKQGDGKISGLEAANQIISMYGDNIVFCNEQFYGYDRGYWPSLDDRVHIKKPLLDAFESKAASKKITDAFELLKIMRAREGDLFSHPPALICLQNGTLDPVTGVMSGHSPSHMLRTRRDIDWNPEASCPLWLQTLDSIFEFDLDKAARINFLQEWFGYCLIPDTSQHKFLWLVGAGGNGKSLILSVLEEMVGREYVSNAHIERLDLPAVRAELEGKLLNVSSEMSANATIADSYLKAIVSGDTVEAERKFKAPFSFRPYVKLIAATNQLPRLLDYSNGFLRRAIILVFNRSFTEAEQDRTLADKLKLERPGILRWAVEGLQRLQQQGLTIPSSSIAAVQQYCTEADIVSLFLSEEMTIVETGGMTPNELYGDFRRWCEMSGFKPLNISSFGKRLSACGILRRSSNGQKFWRVERKSSVPAAEVTVSELASKYEL